MQHQQQANGLGGGKQAEAAALLALAGAALPDGPAGYPFKPEGSNGSDQTGQRRLLPTVLSSAVTMPVIGTDVHTSSVAISTPAHTPA